MDWLCLSFLGGLIGIGIGIGWNMMTAKKSLPNGEQIFAYQEVDRQHGEGIVILGAIMFIISINIRAISQI